jgi:predicted transcriptional regulator
MWKSPGLLLEARQLREFGWTEKRIGETLDVPQQTISRWLNNGYGTSEIMGIRYSNTHNGTTTLPTSITLYQAKYEEVGDKIPPESVDLKVPQPTIS